MSSRGYLPINFKQYRVFTSGLNESSVRFDVSTRSLDRIWHMTTNNRCADASSNRSVDKIFYSPLFYSDYPKALRSVFPQTQTSELQFDLAGVQIPQRAADLYELFQQTMNSLPQKGARDEIHLPPPFTSWRDRSLDTRGVTLSGNLRLKETQQMGTATPGWDN
eukprot:scaffold166332_cov27-Tisochrysis_lutea.AAC.1